MSIDATTRVLKSWRPKYVYFARVGEYLKVGCSHNPQQRVKQIRHGNGTRPADLDQFAPAELIRFVPAGPSRTAFNLEGDYMFALADYHVAGEWFHAAPAVLAWIADLDPELQPRQQRPLETPAAPPQQAARHP